MKKIVVFLAAFLLIFSSCKIFKQSGAPAESTYTSDNTAPTKVFTVPGSETNETKPAEKAEKPAETIKEESKKVVPEPAPIIDEKPIAVRKEQVSFTEQVDQTANAGNTYFVILGSFSQLENAKNARSIMIDEGFTPIILHSETGYYRVCVNSYKSEIEARNRVTHIRQTFPKYADLWLLIKE